MFINPTFQFMSLGGIDNAVFSVCGHVYVQAFIELVLIVIRFHPRGVCFGRASLAKSCFHTVIYRS